MPITHPPPLPSQRSLFDIPEEIAYFNCSYNTPQLNASRSAVQQSSAEKSQPWRRRAEDFFTDAETLRTLAATLFGGAADSYAIIPAASYGMSTAARIIEPLLGPGDRIVILDGAFPSEFLPLLRAAEERGAVLQRVARPDDGDWSAAILQRLDRRVKVLTLPHCHWSDGTQFDLVAIGTACHELGIIFCVDATQSLGALPLDVMAIKADFLLAAGYKWLLAPYGVALLYVAETWHTARPLEESWLARDNARDFTSLAHCTDLYQPGARRFDMGEKCHPLLPGAIAALRQLKAWGIETIARSLATINTPIQEELERLGFELPPAHIRSPHMFGARLPSHVQHDIVAALAQQNIFLSQRGDAIRIAPHLHINEQDISRLLDAVTRLAV